MSDLQDLAGSLLDNRYLVEREVGSGGMSTVFVAEDEKHSRSVALKILRPDVAAALGTERFLREIELASTLNHPNILPVHDSGVFEGLLYCVMPFAEGEGLRERLAREGPLPLETALQVAIECASALEYAHRKGIVHRDVKPGNILLPEGHSVVCDFGVAQAVEYSADTVQLTLSGVAVGTPSYMSPEQAVGEERVDGRSDIYGLGCVLYEMLVGEPPFSGRNARVVIARHVAESPPSVTLARPGIPESLEAVVQRCLAKAPVDRFETAAELVSALEDVRAEVLTGVPVKRRKRRRPWIGFAAAGALAALGLWWAVNEIVPNGSRLVEGPSPTRMAVLPFEVSEGEGLTTFADGLTNRLTDGLGSIETLTVISQLGVRPFVDAAVSVDSIARALNVGTIITGRVEGDSDSIRVSVQLIDGSTGDQLSTTTTGAARSARLSLVDQVADSLEIMIRVSLGETVERYQRLLTTNNLEAYQHLVLSEERIEEIHPSLNGQDLQGALTALSDADSLLGLAEAMDPDWIEPIVHRAALGGPTETLNFLMNADPIPGFLTAIDHATRALEREPSNPVALEHRGYFQARLADHLSSSGRSDTDLEERALSDLRAATVGHPVRARVFQRLAEVFRRSGQIEDALEWGRRAYDEDLLPTEALRTLLGLYQASFALGLDDEVRLWCDQGASRFADPPFFQCKLQLMAWTDAYPVSTDHAEALVDSAMERTHADFRPLFESNLKLLLAAVYVRDGRQDEARGLLPKGESNDMATGDFAVYLGVRDLLGEQAEAVDLLRSRLERFPGQRRTLTQNRALRALLARPEYQGEFTLDSSTEDGSRRE